MAIQELKVYLEKSEVSKETIRKTRKLRASQRERLKSHDKRERMQTLKTPMFISKSAMTVVEIKTLIESPASDEVLGSGSLEEVRI